jgi:hypothetical protein
LISNIFMHVSVHFLHLSDRFPGNSLISFIFHQNQFRKLIGEKYCLSSAVFSLTKNCSVLYLRIFFLFN